MSVRTHLDGTSRLEHPHGAAKAGPIGRLVRLVLVIAVGDGLVAMFQQAGHFQNAAVLREANFWVFLVVSLIALRDVGRDGLGRSWGWRAPLAFAGLVVAAALASLAVSGSLWGPPVAWLLYGSFVALYALLFVTLAVAVARGTPGCPEGTLARALVTRMLGRQAESPEVAECSIGLNLLDAWEARRAARHS